MAGITDGRGGRLDGRDLVYRRLHRLPIRVGVSEQKLPPELDLVQEERNTRHFPLAVERAPDLDSAAELFVLDYNPRQIHHLAGEQGGIVLVGEPDARSVQLVNHESAPVTPGMVGRNVDPGGSPAKRSFSSGGLDRGLGLLDFGDFHELLDTDGLCYE